MPVSSLYVLQSHTMVPDKQELFEISFFDKTIWKISNDLPIILLIISIPSLDFLFATFDFVIFYQPVEQSLQGRKHITACVIYHRNGSIRDCHETDNIRLLEWLYYSKHINEFWIENEHDTRHQNQEGNFQFSFLSPASVHGSVSFCVYTSTRFYRYFWKEYVFQNIVVYS